ncbi:MAG: toll/interleukin-1 receptor domain-containing protein, partial [Cyanobacteriota bacterium]
MGAIFLSHSSQDNGTTAEIAAWLKARMFEALFLDFDPQLGIPAGRDWEKELQRQLDRCEAVIVLCSA